MTPVVWVDCLRLFFRALLELWFTPSSLVTIDKDDLEERVTSRNDSEDTLSPPAQEEGPPFLNMTHSFLLVSRENNEGIVSSQESMQIKTNESVSLPDFRSGKEKSRHCVHCFRLSRHLATKKQTN